MSDALVLHVGKDAVFGELERSPAFARRVIAALSAKLEATVNELETHALGDGSARFVAWLLRAVPPAQQHGSAVVTLPAAKRAVASQLNLSAEHFSRLLRDLSARKLVEVHRRELRIPDLGRLRQWRNEAR